MPEPFLRIYFDFVDPLSYVASRAFAAGTGGPAAPGLEWVGFELRPPPAPLTAWSDPVWTTRAEAARGRVEQLGIRLAPPALVPWTRKAHELHLYAAAHGRADRVREGIFEAFFEEGADIGRVDVLVEIGAGAGLDRTETKAVLDVDRHEADVAEARRSALELGVRDVPSHAHEGRVRQGFPDLTDLGTLLPDE